MSQGEKSEEVGENTAVIRKHDSKKGKYKKSKNTEKHAEDVHEHFKHKRKSKQSKEKKVKKTSGYEETAGISTPSKEIVSNDIKLSEINMISPEMKIPMYQTLASDKTINMVYELKQLPLETNKVITAILLTNIGENLVKELVFNVSDSSTLKLDRSVSTFFSVSVVACKKN